MTLINIRNLGVTLGTTLFSKLNLTVSSGDRIGLVAANGRGKSTLLRCLAGTLEATEGDVTRSRGLTIGHVDQDVPRALLPLPFHLAVLQVLPADQQVNESWRVDMVLESLEVPEDLRERPVGQLSGGWQRLAMLARVWVTEPDVLLLDEPTNHLDLESREALEAALEAFPGTVLLVSHDRALLDAVAERTLAIEHGRINSYDGGWADYVRSRDDRATQATPTRPAKPKPHVKRELPERKRSTRPTELDLVEDEIATLETTVAELEQQLSEDWANVDVLAKHRRARDDLQALLSRWESLFERSQA
jgi:ATPase subunit of ABC transporter with duplicated ATPase domains